MMSICLMLTGKCDLMCRHCYIDAGPFRTDFLKDDLILKVLNQGASINLEDLWLSGGEVFTDEHRLFSTLDTIMSVKKETGHPKRVIIQTNASWAKDRSTILTVLSRLKSSGVDGIDISSNDEYHAEYMNTQNAIDLYSIATDEYNFSHLELYGTFSGTAQPIGRAQNLSNTIPCQQQKCLLMRNYFIVDTKGDMYPCCWLQTPSIGNIMSQDLRAIASAYSSDPYFSLIHKGGPRLLASKLGWNEGDIQRTIEDSCLCSFCGTILKNCKDIAPSFVFHQKS